MTKFSVGDQVQLKSGGPPKTVTMIEDKGGAVMYNCQWDNFHGAPQMDAYPEGALKLFVPPPNTQDLLEHK